MPGPAHPFLTSFNKPQGAAWHLLAPSCSSAAGWVSSASPSAVPLKKPDPERAGADCALSCCFPGQSGLGKSTLINTLFKSKISRKSVQPTAEERIPKTIEIKSITHGETPQSPAGTLAFGPALPRGPAGLGGLGAPQTSAPTCTRGLWPSRGAHGAGKTPLFFYPLALT